MSSNFNLHQAILSAIQNNTFTIESGSITRHHDGSFTYTLKTKPRDALYDDQAGNVVAQMFMNQYPY